VGTHMCVCVYRGGGGRERKEMYITVGRKKEIITETKAYVGNNIKTNLKKCVLINCPISRQLKVQQQMS
jgi:hypothetical protein